MSSRTDVAEYVRSWEKEGLPLKKPRPVASEYDASHVVLAGGSGLIGSALKWALESRGTRVTQLVRREPRTSNEWRWNPDEGELSPAAIEDADVVISLGGASIGKLPWTAKYRELLFNSRVHSTRTIADVLCSLGRGAPAFISASAVGYYGSQPGTQLDEAADVGSTFLARLCARWEAEALRATEATRVARLRTAPVIDRRGVLKPLIQLAKFGLAGPLGSGKQVWPWISLEDEVGAILHVLDHQLDGPVNLCSPVTATANDIGREVAQQMGRPFCVPAPVWALRFALSREAADSLLISDADVKPVALTSSGYRFTHPAVSQAVSAALARR